MGRVHSTPAIDVGAVGKQAVYDRAVKKGQTRSRQESAFLVHALTPANLPGPSFLHLF
jgi:hypothetical protein